MEGSFGNPTRVAREIGCQFSPANDRIVERRRIRTVVEAVWPHEKPDALTAVICNCSIRTAARYLSGEIDAPAVLFAAIWTELTKHNS